MGFFDERLFRICYFSFILCFTNKQFEFLSRFIFN